MPAVDPERARAIVLPRGGCTHRQGQGRRARPDPADDEARLEAVRDALGPDGRIRVDANGAWSRRRGGRRDRRCSTGPPAAWSTSSSPARSSRTWPRVRRRVDVPIAADESIRRAEDPYRVRDLEAADVAVLKVQPLGGVRACLRIAEDIGLPVVVSSALETSVGIAAGVALAAALPELPLRLRAGDRAAADRRRRRRPAAARRRRAARDAGPTSTPARLAALTAAPERVAHWRRAAGRDRVGRIDAVTTPPPDRNASPPGTRSSTSSSAAASTDVVLCPGLALRARSPSPPTRAADAASRCTRASTSAPPASWRSGSPGPRAARSPS